MLDDDYLLSEQPAIRAPDGLARIWFSTMVPDYWPISYSMYWLEWRLWGHDSHYPHEVSPLGYHLTSLALHVASAVLIWTILEELAIPGALLAAILFTVHPVNVEAVAWMSQQKTTLSLVFFLAAIWCWLKGEAAEGERRGTRDETGGRFWNRWEWSSLVAFLLAGLSKGSAAVLPGILLLVGWWRRGTIERRDVLRLTPFFAVAALLIGVNIWFQAHANIETIRHASLLQRILGANAVVWFYLWKAIWPFDLSFVYPQWEIQPASVWWWLPLVGTIGTTIVLWWKRHTAPGRALLFAWGVFCVALMPVMGMTDVGFMRFALVADHYQYTAIISVMAALAAGIVWLWREGAAWRRWLAVVVTTVVVGGFATLAWQENWHYRDAISIYRAALVKNPGLWMLHGNLGDALFDAGDIYGAIPELQESLNLNPQSHDADLYLAKALRKLGDRQGAIEHYEASLKEYPGQMDTASVLAEFYLSLGRRADAVRIADQAIAYAEKGGHAELAKKIQEWKRTRNLDAGSASENGEAR